MPSSIETGLTLPLIAHLYGNTGTAFKQSFKILNTPDFSLAINGQGASAIVIELDAPLSGGNIAPAKGDILTLTEDGGDGSVVFKGIVEDFPDERGASNVHQILVNPVGVQLGDTPFETNYTSATDIGQMARDAVSATANLTWDAASIPLVGTTAIFDFSGQGFTVLSALDELRRMAGVNQYYWPDMSGKVSFKAVNLAAAATHSVMVAPYTEVRKYNAPVAKRKNIVKAFGAILANATAPLVATYDNSAGSPLGKRKLIPDLAYPKLTDSTTLQSIVNTIGSALDRDQVTVQLDVINYPLRVQPGDTLRYHEESVNERLESAAATGAFSPNYVVIQAKANGPRQSVIAADIPATVQDLKYIIDRMINRTATGSIASAVPAGSTGTISPGMIGAQVPSTPATPSLATAVERVAQADNASITVSWAANPGGDLVTTYQIRWRQGANPYQYIDSAASLSLIVHNLTPGLSYGFSVAAINTLGNQSGWSAEATIVAASDSTGPAVPTGLSAIKTPRGALVSWNANTEADLQGYDLQVSVGGGGFVSVMTKTLVTSFAYVAPSGTALGTSLQFQVRALDWSGNASAFSASSAAVNTDGIVFDEVLAGNVKVFGTLTTGGFQTAASGARVVIDSTSIRLYDGSATNYGAPSGAGVTTELKNDGSAFFKGTISASNIYGSTVATSSVVGTTGNAGFKLSGQFLDLFTIGATPEGTRYYFAPNGASAFVLAGQLAAASSVFAGPVTKTVLQITNFTGLEALTTDNTLGRGFIQTQVSTDANSAIFAGRKARGSIGALSAIAVNDTIAALYAQGYDGTNWIAGGLAGFANVASVAAGAIPMDFIVLTGTNGGNLTEVLRINYQGHWLANGGAAPTLSSLRAGVSSQSLSGNDTILNATISTTGAGVAFAASAVGVNYGNQFGVLPKHALTLASPTGTAAGAFIKSEATTFLDIGVLAAVPSGCTQNYNCIQIGNS